MKLLKDSTSTFLQFSIDFRLRIFQVFKVPPISKTFFAKILMNLKIGFTMIKTPRKDKVMKKNKFKFPRQLITDATLPLTARKVAAALYAYCSYNGQIKKSYRELARITGCAPKTVQQSVELLADAGYITTTTHTTRWDSERAMVMTDTNIYTLSMDFSAGYALLPYRIFRAYRELTPAAFVVCLYIHLAAGAAHRAFPSIGKIAAAVGISRSTVCRAIAIIKSLPAFVVQMCRKKNGAMTCSSYYPVTNSGNSNTIVECSCDHDLGPVVDHLPLSARIKASVHTSIVKLKKKLRNLFTFQGVVPNLLHQER